MASFEFFKKEFEFRGKHARMAGELWIQNDYGRTYFRRLIDLYITAAVIGFRVDRKAKADYAPNESKSIFPEQMIGAKEDLDFIKQRQDGARGKCKKSLSGSGDTRGI